MIIPIQTNKAPTLLEAMKEAITNMGGPPKTIFTDDEGGTNTKLIMQYLEDHKIRHIVTRWHAAVAERTIRTIKAMIYKSLKQQRPQTFKTNDG